MPELPEVEVTKRGIERDLLHSKIKDIDFSDKSLREPFSPKLYNLKNATVSNIERRGKYIVVTTDKGYLLIHLGMTGHLSVLDGDVPKKLHDHFEMILSSGKIIRYNDTRRFGLILYFGPDDSPYDNRPLNELGPEPFSDSFNAEYLHEKLSHYKKSIKQTLMDSAVVVGVGNIYASEVLFSCRINPQTAANKVSKQKCKVLVDEIRRILKESIEKGGTTIRDFQGADGKLGYFVQNLNVYGHEGEKCCICGSEIKKIVQGQRSTFYCPHCQK